MVTAFVLINADEAKPEQTAARLLTFDGVTEVHIVAGEYDMVATLRVADNRDLLGVITERILHTDGVERTKTLIALQTHSRIDLDKVFEGV